MLQSAKKMLLLGFLCVVVTAQSQPQSESQVDSSVAKSPGKALLFSVIPGGGQLYNRRPVKSLLFAGAFFYYGYKYSEAQEDYETDLANSKLHRARNDKIWMLTLIWTLNILDAYVDAQLWDFEAYDIDGNQIPEESETVKPKEVRDIDDTE